VDVRGPAVDVDVSAPPASSRAWDRPRTEVDGRVLDDEEATNFSMALMLAGYLTTTVQPANVVRTLDEHPEQWAAVREDPGLIRAHVEPDRFDPRRGIGGAAQLALGHGIHFCLGAPLARLETRVVLEEIPGRWDRLVVERDPDDPTDGLLPYAHLVVGTRHLPVPTATG
jgi:erythromycin 12 hydroxylase